jgi:hypothetical protein
VRVPEVAKFRPIEDAALALPVADTLASTAPLVTVDVAETVRAAVVGPSAA